MSERPRSSTDINVARVYPERTRVPARRRGKSPGLPWWVHVIVLTLIVGSAAASVATGNPLFGWIGCPVNGAEPESGARGRHRVARWPLVLLALPAFVSIWGGGVGLGELAGFGVIRLLPGDLGRVRINTAVTLPIALETYAAYALNVALSGRAPTRRARVFAAWSAVVDHGYGGYVAGCRARDGCGADAPHRSRG